MPKYEAVFEIVDYGPYPSLARGLGRWFTLLGLKTKQPIGLVWTNGENGFGLIRTNESPELDHDVELFMHNRSAWASANTSASEAFEATLELQEDMTGEKPEVTSGDLLTGLRAVLEDEMATTAEYAITFREDGEVLELVRYDIDGTFYRVNEAWEPVDPEAEEEDYPTIYGQEMEWVSEGVLEVFDRNSGSESFNKTDVQEFIV